MDQLGLARQLGAMTLRSSSHMAEILRILPSLQMSFRDQRSELLQSLSEWMKKLYEWMPELSDAMQRAIRALFDQVGAFAAALKRQVSFFDHGATQYLPDFTAKLVLLNQRISTIDESDLLQARFDLEDVRDIIRSLFDSLMAGIKAAKNDNAWVFIGLVGTSTAIGGVVGAAISAPIAAEAAVNATTQTVWGSISAFLGTGISAGRTGAAVSAAAVAAAPVIVGGAAAGAAVGLMVGGIGYIQKKRNDNEIDHRAKLQAIDLRDTVRKIKRSSQRLLLDVTDQDERNTYIALINALGNLEQDLMEGVLN